MFCPNCGNKLENGQTFCAVCGNVIDFGDDVTVGAFENSAPVAPQPEYVEPVAPVAPQPEYVAPVAPVAPQPEYVEPVADEATIGVYESFAPAVPQVEYEAPVVEEVVAAPSEPQVDFVEPSVDSTFEYTALEVPQEAVADVQANATAATFGYNAPVEPQYDFGAPVVPQDNCVAPVEPQYDFGAPVVPQNSYVAPVEPQNNYVAPVAPVAPATDVPPAAPVNAAETKKEKKRNAFLIGFFGAVALGLIAGIIALVVFFTRPDVSIVRAAKKTLLDSQSFSFEIYYDGEGKVLEGKVAFGENHKDSGFYVTSGEEYEEIGYYNNKIYSSDGSEDISEAIENINDSLGEAGFDITVDEALDMLIDEEINEDAVFDIYESQYENIQDFLDEQGVEIELPEPKELKSSAGDIFKGIPEDAFEYDQDIGLGKKTIKYEVDLEKLVVGLIEGLAEDEEYAEYFEEFEEQTGEELDDILEDIEDTDFPDVEGKCVIEWGYLVEFSLKVDGEGFKIKFKDINKTEVNQETMDDIEVCENEDDYYEDDYYDDYYDDDYYNTEADVPVAGVPVTDRYDDSYYDDYYDDYYYNDYYNDYYDDYYNDYYDDYYDDYYNDYYDDYYEDDYYDDEYYEDNYYYDAYIDADTYSVYLDEGETASILVDCWGSDLPSTYNFYVEYPSGVSTYWGEWESNTSCYLYVTGEYSCDNYMTIYLQDEYGNNYDYIDVYVCVY